MIERVYQDRAVLNICMIEFSNCIEVYKFSITKFMNYMRKNHHCHIFNM